MSEGLNHPKCPWQGCEGTLEYDGAEETLIGTLHGLNKNTATETWVCPTCRRCFSRTWKWEQLEKRCEHTPIWRTATFAQGVQGVVDVCCSKCGANGSTAIDEEDILW